MDFFYFTVWKNTVALGYVTGPETAAIIPTSKPLNVRMAASSLSLPAEPGAPRGQSDIHDTHQGVADTLKEVVSLQAQAKAIVHKEPRAKLSPQ